MENTITSFSVISEKALIGKNVQIGNFCKIYDNVSIGDNTIIEDYCIIGRPTGKKEKQLVIGNNSIIRSHTVIYEGSIFESRLETGHHVLIRENTKAGENLRIGSYSDIEGDVIIGDYVRFHSYVHVGKGSKIGNFVWLYSLVTLTNDPLPPSLIEQPVVIEDGVVVCVNSTILPGAHLELGVFVSAGSKVTGNIPAGRIVTGNSQIVGHVSKLINPETGLKHPWMNHFYTKYPKETHERINLLREKILTTYKTKE